MWAGGGGVGGGGVVARGWGGAVTDSKWVEARDPDKRLQSTGRLPYSHPPNKKGVS